MIEIKNVTKKFGDKVILDDLSLTIEKGSLVVFIGSSGCGKTTTLKLINKLIKPTSGEIYIDGKAISQEDTIELRRKIGYVIQNTGLFPHLTIKENIELIPVLKKEKSIEEIEKTTEELLEMVGLRYIDYKDKYPSQLSGGQQQRIGVARAIATGAEIILMDEPFSALDPITRTSLQEELFTLQNELKKTIIFVTHDMDEALNIADKICIMDKGRIAQYDTPENILRNPASEFIKDFIGPDRVWNNPEYIKAKDIMIDKIVSTNKSRTIVQGTQMMKRHSVDSLLLVDNKKNIQGLVRLKDVRKTNNLDSKLENIMITNIRTVNENDNLVDILEMIKEHSIEYVPVVNDKNELSGLITYSRLVEILSGQYIDSGVDVLG